MNTKRIEERLSRDLEKAGQPNAKVEIIDADGEGYPLASISSLELGPEQVPALARALQLIGHNSKKALRTFDALLAMVGYESY